MTFSVCSVPWWQQELRRGNDRFQLRGDRAVQDFFQFDETIGHIRTIHQSVVVRHRYATSVLLVQWAICEIRRQKRGRILDFDSLSSQRRQEKCSRAMSSFRNRDIERPPPQRASQERGESAQLPLLAKDFFDGLSEISLELCLQYRQGMRFGLDEP